MDENRHYAKRDPELVFLDECIAFVKVLEARTRLLLAEYENIKRAIANEAQPEAGNDGV